MTPERPSHASSARGIAGAVLGLVVAAALGVGGAVALAGSQPDAVASGPTTSPQASGSEGPTEAATPSASPSPTPSVTPDPTVTFSLVAGGDILTHEPVLRSARSGDGYDFSEQFAPTSNILSGADIALCHLEVPVVPKGKKPSGYPMFGAPKSLVGDLADAGWDGCSTASNHSVDRGFAGIEATLDAMQAAGVGHAGTARSKDESTQVQYYDVFEGDREVRVAHISYTYGLNGLPKPEGKPWAVNVFDSADADASSIIDAAQDARDDGADVVVASVHCCVEYTTQPNSTQKSIAKQIADSGLVDLYIGHHAHVPQPIKKLKGGPGGDGMWVAYGLGNFISNQDASTVGHPETANGLLLRATFTVTPEDDVSVDVGWTAVTVDRTHGHVVYPISEDSGSVGELSASQVKSRWKLVAKAAGDAAPEIPDAGEPLADRVEVSVRTP
ncbi:CapA family protein [Demequina sp.]|uniref:CapA family protein n=1 Tax=Demequina sp. TaxID=2050685 RepID=UPI003D14ABFE